MHVRAAVFVLAALATPLRAQSQVTLAAPNQEPVQTAAVDEVGPAVDALEIDFLTSYYSQDGTHSAVTGGIGTEEQTVISPVVVIRWQLSDLWTVGGTLGVDNITSASVNNMDNPNMEPGDGVSGASKVDQRAYTTLTATRHIGEQNLTFGLGASSEYDYLSFSGGFGWSRDFAQKNTTLAASIWQYEDTVELYDIFGIKGGSDSRSTTALSTTLTQVLGRRTVVLADLSASLQSGFLSTPFQEVILAGGQHVAERLPDSRNRYAIGFRLNHAFTSSVVQKAYYRFYDDDWQVSANTIELETHFRLGTATEMWLFPILRFHDQTASDYFALPGDFTGTEDFFTADRDLSGFSSEKYGVGWKLLWGKGRSGPLRLDRFEVRLTSYSRDDGLDAITTAFDFGWKY
jgi:hypothetical protein